MKKPIYQTRNGVRVTLTSRDIKAFVMKERGWTSEQYNKEYDKLRNRVRAYEGFQRASGVEVEKQSPAAILYFESRAMKLQKEKYRPTIELERLYSFPTISSGKALTKRLENNIEKFQSIYLAGTVAKFAGLLEANPKAMEIFSKIDDPVIIERALTDYANKLYAQIKKYHDDQAIAAIPFGQAVGSDTAIDFDIEEYL